MRDLITYIAQSVVSDPDAVQVQEKHRARSVTLYLKVAPHDMGRVIGKGGRMANAMRTLLRVAAVKEGKQVTLEIGR